MSKKYFLEFEQPIADLETKIEELRYVQNESAVDISEEIDRLSKKSQQLTKDVYANVAPWQVYQIARHPQRPQTLDYCSEVFTEFEELHGDRHFSDDAAIVGGLARFNGQACMVVGHQRGSDSKERAQRNFGMPRPEGYRKALRLMKLAEKFGLPIHAIGVGETADDLLDRQGFFEALEVFLHHYELDLDWASAKSAPTEPLINSLAAALPFAPTERQALLEAATLSDRCAAMIALMRINAARPADDQSTPLQ